MRKPSTIALVATAAFASLTWTSQIAAQDSTASNIVTSKPRHKPTILKARQSALEAIASDGFSQDLQNFMNLYGSSDKIDAWNIYPEASLSIYDAQWKTLDHNEIMTGLETTAPNLKIQTYGGVKARFLKVFHGNLAKEGTGTGPILLNRYGLNRTNSSIAGSIIHEAAHRIGLRHDNFNSEKNIGRCEPPYVIDQLLEKQIQGAAWTYKAGAQCVFLKDL